MAGYFNHFPKSDFDLVSSNGDVKGTFKGLFSKEGVTVPNIDFDANPGDEIRRKLPNGKDEVFEVLSTYFQEKFHVIEAHFKVEVRRKGIMENKSGGNYVHVSGQNARVLINSSDYSSNTYGISSPIYKEVRDAISQIESQQTKDLAISALEKMESAKDSNARLSGFQELISSMSSDIAILTPFIQPLTALLTAIGGGG